MKQCKTLRQKNNNALFAVIASALCVVLTASLLTSRLINYSPTPNYQYIPLTVSSGSTHVTTMAQAPQQTPRVVLLAETETAPTPPATEEATPPQETTWLSITDLELFRLSYENGEGVITVHSTDGDNVVAPGTSHTFHFALQNTSEFGLDYDIEIEAYFTMDGGDKNIPIDVRLWDYTGNYLIGSAQEFEDLSDINTASGQGSISANYIAPYSIEWQWPFEGNDELDTFLGNYFMKEDAQVSLVIEVRVIAEQGGEGGVPPTGDNSNIMVYAIAMVGSFIGFLVVLLMSQRKREENEAQ